MLKNVIILTSGQSGSSVLTALIARSGGYWFGDETKKVGDETKRFGYDTYENSKLVDLNGEVLKAAGLSWKGALVNESAAALAKIQGAAKTMDQGRVRAFLDECAAHRPWIWKDPRLCYTMPFWETQLDFSECQFLVVGRDLRQAWSAHMVRGRQPMSFGDFSKIFGGILDAGNAYVRSRNLPHLTTTFEDVTLEPERVISELNAFLGTSVTMEDMRQTYKGPLGKLRWSRRDYLEAWARYQAHRWIFRDVSRLENGAS